MRINRMHRTYPDREIMPPRQRSGGYKGTRTAIEDSSSEPATSIPDSCLP
ncbi:MAG: hypothetical protein JWM18_1887 [Chloroflexi bacterium]|jgi:hypothetical protein|nr:hypothetical protein [Chloroflexota bacterium]